MKNQNGSNMNMNSLCSTIQSKTCKNGSGTSLETSGVVHIQTQGIQTAFLQFLKWLLLYRKECIAKKIMQIRLLALKGHIDHVFM